MNRKEMETEIKVLKSDYVRIQGDMDKMEVIGNGKMTKPAEKQLIKIEDQLAELRQKLDALD